jgi:hypothetical protein
MWPAHILVLLKPLFLLLLLLLSSLLCINYYWHYYFFLLHYKPTPKKYRKIKQKSRLPTYIFLPSWICTWRKTKERNIMCCSLRCQIGFRIWLATCFEFERPALYHKMCLCVAATTGQKMKGTVWNFGSNFNLIYACFERPFFFGKCASCLICYSAVVYTQVTTALYSKLCHLTDKQRLNRVFNWDRRKRFKRFEGEKGKKRDEE